MPSVARILHRDDHPLESGLSRIVWVEIVRNSCLLSVKREIGVAT